MKNTVLIALICLPIGLFAQVVDSVALKTVDSLIQVSRTLTGEGAFDKALEVIAAAEVLALEKSGRETVIYVVCCQNHGRILHIASKFDEAKHWYLEAKEIREKIIGKENPDYAAILNNLALVYKELGDMEKAESFNLEALTIREKLFTKDHIVYSISLNNLGVLYYDMGAYEKAEPFYLETKSIRGKILGTEHPDYASSLNNLGNLYSDLGDHEKAESHYLEAMSIREKVLGKDHVKYGESLNNLAILYWDMGNYEKSEIRYLEAMSIREKEFGKEHQEYASCLDNLALLYSEMGKLEKAESLHLEAKDIRKKTLGLLHTDYAISLHNLANYYEKKGLHEKAEHMYLEALSIREKAFGRVSPIFAKSLLNLAFLYVKMRDYKKAEPLYIEAMAIQEKTLGTAHPMFALSLDLLAQFHWTSGDLSSAKAILLKARDIENKLLYKASRHLSEQELSAFTRKFEIGQSRDFSFAQLQPDMATTCYDNTLFHKGFLLNAVSQVNKLAQSDPATTEQYNQLKSYQRRLAAEYAKPIAERKTTAELEEKANTLEKDLTRNVAGFGEALRQVTWQEVQQNLRPGEAAIEFVHYNFINPKPTDSTMYAALVMLPDGKPPKFIPLFEEKQLEKLLLSTSKTKADKVNDLYANSSLYDLLWLPLEQALNSLGVAGTLYYSPSGLLYRLNIGAIPMPPMLRGEQTEVVLNDRFHLIELGSTKQLAFGSQQTAAKGTDALLYGGIQYEMDSTALASAIASLGENPVATRRGLDFANADSTLRGGKWGYLRWTDVEVNTTAEILADAGLRPMVRKGYVATEESFKAIGTSGPSPRILHLATHGFFFPDPKTAVSGEKVSSELDAVFKMSEHPMIRAGLVLAGGNHAWQTGKPFRPDREDGILTAYEISQMNLSKTELVVLSACETGLGDIQGNEGVYGLQRAFKIAGAKYLIMSLWQVPDFQTQELMTSFYSLWLEDKMPIPDAFRAAQKLMREKYKNPFLWAGFVLVE